MCLFFPAIVVFRLYLRKDILGIEVLKYFTRTCLIIRICLIWKLNHNEKSGMFKVFTGTKMLIKSHGKILLLFLAVKHNDETKLP